MYAVIKTGGKQYRVKEGDVLDVEKLGVEQGGTVIFDRVLLIEDEGKVLVGTPDVAGAAVKAEVVENFKDDKVLIFKKKRRKQYRRTKGHRQQLAKVRIVKIYADVTLVPKEELQATPPAAKPAVTAAPKAPAAPKKPVIKPVPKVALAEKKAKKPAAVAEKAAAKKKTPAKPKPAVKPKKAAKE
jgi:large subunit ribosomal protein L21